jgi:hypothetical protein
MVSKVIKALSNFQILSWLNYIEVTLLCIVKMTLHNIFRIRISRVTWHLQITLCVYMPWYQTHRAHTLTYSRHSLDNRFLPLSFQPRVLTKSGLSKTVDGERTCYEICSHYRSLSILSLLFDLANECHHWVARPHWGSHRIGAEP